MWVYTKFSGVWLFVTLGTVAHQVPLSRDSLGKNTGAGCHILLQEIFLTQGWNCVSFVFCIDRGVLYHKHHQRSPATISKSTFPVLFYFLCWIFPSRLSPSPSAFQHTLLYPILMRLHRGRGALFIFPLQQYLHSLSPFPQVQLTSEPKAILFPFLYAASH